MNQMVSIQIFIMFSFTRDLLAAFCSIFVRMYLNFITGYFSDLMLQLSLYDEKKVVRKIFTFADLLLYNFFDFFEFFYLFGQANVCDCYNIWKNKPKYGPYHGPKGTLEVIMF